MQEHTQDCDVVRAGTSFIGKQGLSYRPGISAQTVGARGLHMQLAVLRPGLVGAAHKHQAHETAIYVLSGRSAMWFGEGLGRHIEVEPGDFLYIPADMPHQPYNPDTDCVVLLGKTERGLNPAP